jgi:RNA 2',3'-cyclic 3'-phosphodiesterase
VRLFAALALPPQATDRLAAAVARARAVDPSLRWVPPEQWHLTLAFFGEVPEPRVDDLTERLRRASSRTSPIAMRLGPPATFGSVSRARVVYTGLVDGAQATSRLAASCRAAGRRIGLTGDDLAPDARFRPHVTLARVAPPRDVTEVLAALTTDDPPGWRCSQALLVRSDLGAGEGGRPRHQALARLDFRQPSAAR